MRSVGVSRSDDRRSRHPSSARAEQIFDYASTKAGRDDLDRILDAQQESTVAAARKIMCQDRRQGVAKMQAAVGLGQSG